MKASLKRLHAAIVLRRNHNGFIAVRMIQLGWTAQPYYQHSHLPLMTGCAA